MKALSRNNGSTPVLLESLRALAIELGDRNDEARYQLGLLLATARQNSEALYKDLVHLLRERYEKRTLDNYASVASAFPPEMYSELRAQNANLGFSAFVESAKLPERLRISFLQFCSANWLKVQQQRHIAARIKQIARSEGLDKALERLTDNNRSAENNALLPETPGSKKRKVVLEPADCQIIGSYLLVKLNPDQVQDIQQMPINRIEIS